MLDFFAGSGTTAAVAHKMNRQWIAVEQMDYIRELTLARLQKAIEGEQGGVSEIVGWQGGGSFVYAELAESNSAFADRIRDAKNINELKKIFDEMMKTGYLHYKLDLVAFDNDKFKALELKEQKWILMNCLDANHLYVNLGSLGDEAYSISENDAQATRDFYRDKT